MSVYQYGSTERPVTTKMGGDAGRSLLMFQGLFDLILGTLYLLSQGTNGFRYHVSF